MPPTSCDRLYAQMLREARAAGLPKRFDTDLTHHDRRFVEDHPGASFLWLLYEDGTHVVTLGRNTAHTLEKVHRCLREDWPTCRLYWVSGEGLELVELEVALERVEQHVRLVEP